ncbi:MAG: hypothetical protein NUV80_03790 [Candidatus Berkelbacteria bacterium]|nr:hypothetical protein [Candidatus Berkelbacteria bacterium]
MFKQYRPLEMGEHILVGGDTAAGMGDYSTCVFLSRKKLDIPLVYHTKSVASQMTIDVYPALEKISDFTNVPPTIAYERNNGGVFEMDRLASLNRAGKFSIFKPNQYGVDDPQETAKLGWDTNTATRPAMLGQLKEAIDKQLIGIYDRNIINELLSFVVVQTTSTWKARAERGAHDDLVMALAIAWQLYRLVPEPVAHNYDAQAHEILKARQNEDYWGM